MMGIYLITVNRGGGEEPYFYVGQGKDIYDRQVSHIWELRRGTHHKRPVNKPDPLQACFNKYGEAALVWDKLEEVDAIEQLTERETAWYWYYINEYGKSRVLNGCVPGDNPMNNPEVRARNAEAARNRSSEAKANQAEANRKGAQDPEREANRKAALVAAIAKHYVFRDPQGNLVEVYNLNAFCKERGLSTGNMVNVSKGKLRSNKGWTRGDD
jgi:hypothetical protein